MSVLTTMRGIAGSLLLFAAVFVGSAGVTCTDCGATPTPEPASMLLLGTGLLGVAGAARRRFRKASKP